jgi:hypothetical protein
MIVQAVAPRLAYRRKIPKSTQSDQQRTCAEDQVSRLAGVIVLAIPIG